MKAVILAAGKGTRMKEITETIPKPMVLIGRKPMLEHILTNIRLAGITEICLVVGYKKSVIEDYFSDGMDFGVRLTYIEQKEQNGTGAALHLAKEFVASQQFLFSFGDVLTPAENYTGMIKYYQETSCDLLLGLNTVDDPYRGAAVYLDEEQNIIKMVEKPPIGTSTTNLVNAGIMLLSPDIFRYTANLKLSPRGEYELTDIFGRAREEGKCLKGYVLSGFWKDVGTPEDLARINSMLK
jgi:NDP-sugar pyrophosphorylase family protein